MLWPEALTAAFGLYQLFGLHFCKKLLNLFNFSTEGESLISERPTIHTPNGALVRNGVDWSREGKVGYGTVMAPGFMILFLNTNLLQGR